MKKLFIMAFLCSLLLLEGCFSNRTITFSNMSYDDVYNKSIQYINMKGWAIYYENKEANTIKASLRPYDFQLIIIFHPQTSSVVVDISGASSYPPYHLIQFIWNADATINEYENYVKS